MDKVQQRNTVLMEENNQLKHKVESLDRSVTTATNTQQHTTSFGMCINDSEHHFSNKGILFVNHFWSGYIDENPVSSFSYTHKFK